MAKLAGPTPLVVVVGRARVRARGDCLTGEPGDLTAHYQLRDSRLAVVHSHGELAVDYTAKKNAVTQDPVQPIGRTQESKRRRESWYPKSLTAPNGHCRRRKLACTEQLVAAPGFTLMETVRPAGARTTTWLSI
ncbi:hypothetical protein FKP32DRAFT_958152 [Trametes sanguinea]|nr:hypothetical protein FKP32DRAFT_958152 [Trametes sanguinea]